MFFSVVICMNWLLHKQIISTTTCFDLFYFELRIFLFFSSVIYLLFLITFVLRIWFSFSLEFLVFRFLVIVLLSYMLFFVFKILYVATHPPAQWIANNEDNQISPLDSSISHQESITDSAFRYLPYD